MGSQVGSHRQPTQGDSESTEAFDNRYLLGIQLQWPTPADREDLVRMERDPHRVSVMSTEAEF